MKKRRTFLAVAVLLLLSACGTADPTDASLSGSTETDRGRHQTSTEHTELPATDKPTDDTPQYDYLEGYAALALFQEIAAIENTCDPDELQSILTELYGEEISYTKIGYEENLQEYEETGNGFSFQVTALYDVSKTRAPVETDVYVFLAPYNETPLFIMDGEKACPVGKYEIKNFDDGTYCHSVSA